MEVTVPNSVVIGLMVFSIDRLFVLVPLVRDSAGHRLRILALRGAVSLVIGMFISHGLVLYAYADTLGARVEDHASAAADTAAADVIAGAKEPRMIGDLEQANADPLDDNTAMQKVANRKHQAWVRNTKCVGDSGLAPDGDFCGDGGVSPALLQEWETIGTTPLPPRTADNLATIAGNEKKASGYQDADVSAFRDGAVDLGTASRNRDANRAKPAAGRSAPFACG